MVNLSALLSRLFELHSRVPRALWRNGGAFHPLHLILEVTFRCNLRCTFCEYLDVIEGTAVPVGPVKEFELEEIKGLIDQFGRSRLITFSGGETLMRKDFPEILAYASAHHRTHVISNGALINERIAQQYVDLAPRWIWGNGLVLVGISLEGDETRHDAVVQRRGSWQRTTDGIRHMLRFRRETKKAFPKFVLMLVVTKDTASGLVDFMHLAHDLGVDIVNFIAEHDIIRHAGILTGHPAESRLSVPQPPPQGVDPSLLREQLVACFALEKRLGLQVRLTPGGLPVDEFVRHYTPDRALDPKHYICGSAWARLAVSADGRYSPACPYFLSGDTRSQTLPQVWNGEEFRAFRRTLRDDRVYPACNGCCNLKYVGPQ